MKLGFRLLLLLNLFLSTANAQNTATSPSPQVQISRNGRTTLTTEKLTYSLDLSDEDSPAPNLAIYINGKGPVEVTDKSNVWAIFPMQEKITPLHREQYLVFNAIEGEKSFSRQGLASRGSRLWFAAPSGKTRGS